MRSSDHVRQRVRVRVRGCWLDLFLATGISVLTIFTTLQAQTSSVPSGGKGPLAAVITNDGGF
jgi:hypothetical protein